MQFRTFLLFAVVSTVLATPTQKGPVRVKLERIQPYYNQYREKQFDKTLTEFIEYCHLNQERLEEVIEEVIDRLEALDVEDVTVCHLITDNLENVLQPFTRYIDVTCNEHHNLGYFSGVMVTSVVSIFQYVCESNGEHLLELVNPCWGCGEDTTDEKQCIKDAFQILEEQHQNDFTEKDMVLATCESLYEAYEKCAQPKLDNCKLQITKDSVHGLFEAIMAPCPVKN